MKMRLRSGKGEEVSGLHIWTLWASVQNWWLISIFAIVLLALICGSMATWICEERLPRSEEVQSISRKALVYLGGLLAALWTVHKTQQLVSEAKRSELRLAFLVETLRLLEVDQPLNSRKRISLGAIARLHLHRSTADVVDHALKAQYFRAKASRREPDGKQQLDNAWNEYVEVATGHCNYSAEEFAAHHANTILALIYRGKASRVCQLAEKDLAFCQSVFAALVAVLYALARIETNWFDGIRAKEMALHWKYMRSSWPIPKGWDLREIDGRETFLELLNARISEDATP